MENPFSSTTFLPRLDGAATARALAGVYRKPLDDLVDLPFDLKGASFHPYGEDRASAESLAWLRAKLNEWAYRSGFPHEPNSEQKSAWDVRLGLQLHEHLGAVPELHHPNVWCWLAVRLLPHLVVYRWDWPQEADGQPPTRRAAWDRFGSSTKNGLLLALNRIVIYGPDIAERATEQEFQSLQYRPAFGADPRVARLIMRTVLDAYDDPSSNYGKNGGNRSLDNNHVCVELRYINSLRPLCFMSDEAVVEIVLDTINRLPDLRLRNADTA